MRSGSLTRALAAAALAIALGAGCGKPEDESLLRFLGFQAAGSSGTGSVSMIEGDVRDGTALKVDASFENQTISLGSAGDGMGGITVYRVDVDYSMAGLDPPSFSYPVSLYAPPAAAGSKDATGGGTVVLSDIPIVPVSVKQWLIDHNAAGGNGVIEMTAKVDFQARTDAGEDLTVDGALAVTLTDAGSDGGGGGDGGTTESVVTIAAEDPIAKEGGAHGTFRVYRSGSTSLPLSVSFQVSGTATPGATSGTGVDYRTISGPLGISSGSPSDTLDVEAFTDTVTPETETVIVTLRAGTGYTVGQPNSATVFVRDSI